MPNQSTPDLERRRALITNISSRFKEIAKRYAQDVAVKSQHGMYTYQELERLSRSLAVVLRQKLGTAPRPVALLLVDGLQTIVGLLGVIRAGHFYCALSQKDSPAHLGEVLQDLDSPLIITDDQSLLLAQNILPPGCGLLLFSDIQEVDNVPLPDLNDPETRLGIFYTSGSTGSPKGVLRTHSYILHRLEVDVADYALRAGDRLLYMRQFNVSASLSSIFDVLLTGATLVLYDIASLGMVGLAEFLAREQITIFVPPIELLRRFLGLLDTEKSFPFLRCVILGGDVLYRRDVERLRQHLSENAILVHHLSSSEAGLLARTLLCHDTLITTDIVPLGFPVRGKEVVILDPKGKLLNDGTPGEICVRSEITFPGYWHQSDLTSRKFRPDPTDPTRQLFCTGDLGCFMPDGQLIFLGRNDFRVKIRGFSVDLASVESALMVEPAVNRALVVTMVDPVGYKRLIAYVTLVPGAISSSGKLRTFLLEHLPAYMVPTVFVFLSEFPLTANMKIDRQAFPAPDWTQLQTIVPYTAPVDEVEEQLVSIWKRVLGVERVGTDDSFYDIGGDSLLAMSLFIEIEQLFGVRLPLRTLIDRQSIHEIAPLIRDPKVSEMDLLVELGVSGNGLPVFLTPGGNGDLLGLLPLARLLEGKQPVYGLQAAGVDGKHLYKQPVEAIARQFINAIRTVQPAGPYRLVGASFGGAVAYEMALKLGEEGETVELLGMIDTLPPGPRSKPNLLVRLRIHWQNLRATPRQKYYSYIMDWWKVFLVALARRKLFRRLFTVEKLDTRIQGTEIFRVGRAAYALYEPRPYPGNVVIFRAKDKPWYVNWDTMEGWKRHVKGKITLVDVDGTHGSVYKVPYVIGLAKAISAFL